jgi:hypothetical protein
VKSANDRPVLTAYDVAAAILLLALACDVALTFRSYGFTTDEAVDHLKAVRIVDFFASYGTNRELAKIDEINIYGAMPDLLALVLQKLVPSLSYDSRHLVSAAFGTIGIYYSYRLGRVFISPAAGLFAALLLTCNPMWFGHMFFNAKDIPFAAMLLASLYYCLGALTGRSGNGWIWLKAGLTTGLFASTKLIAILVLGAIGLVSFGCLICVPATEPVQLDRALLIRLAKLGGTATLGCLLCFAAFWPQFFLFGPAELVRIVRLFMNYEPWQGTVQIHGDFIPFDHVPWYYTSAYLLISMPLVLLALIATGATAGICRRQPFVIASVIVCIAFPAYQAISGARALNGYRHFIFLVPFLMLIAAYPIGYVLSEYRMRMIHIAAVVCIATLPTLVSIYQLFPYQYSFYNSLVGGVPGADGRYYIDLWRSALREALRTIENLDDARDAIGVYGSCGSVFNFAGHPRLKPIEKPEDADYIVVLRRGCDPANPPTTDWPIVGEVRRQGVLFATIHARRGK